jgi:hypothetical protein
MIDFQPFEGATNRTATIALVRKNIPAGASGKGSRYPNIYPVSYTVWKKRRGERIETDMSLVEVLKATKRIKMGAVPVDKHNKTSSWLTAYPNVLAAVQKVTGNSDYQAYAGTCGWLNGVYWIHVLKILPNGNLLINNLYDIGKKKVKLMQAQIEPDLVFPLLRGRDVKRWCIEPSVYTIVPWSVVNGDTISEPDMKGNFHKTYAYFNYFREKLLKRSGYRLMFKKRKGPFYSITNVGQHTFMPWKVVWPEVGNEVRASVSMPKYPKLKISNRTPLPDHTVISVSCYQGKNEAYYLSACLNSLPSRSVSIAYIALHPSPHILDHISIPQFNPKNKLHFRLAELSEEAHKLAAKGKDVSAVEAEIDKAAAKLWGLTNDELKAVQDSVRPRAKKPG